MGRVNCVRATRARVASLLLPVVLSCLWIPASGWCQVRFAVETDSGRAALIDTIAVLLERRFVLVEQAGTCATALRSRHASGAYDAIADPAAFAAAVTADLRAITGDAHALLRVIESSDVGEEAQSALHHPLRLFWLSQEEHLGYSRLEWLPGRVAYLDLRRFYPISQAQEMIDAAMRFLSGADAVIIDLRENRGGAGESLPYLASYFLPYPTQLTSYYSRETDFLTEYWTRQEVGAGRLLEVPLFLLTSERTFSAAEILAYDMQVRARATIVGSPTGGGAHSVDLFQLDDVFEIYISTARAINPVTNSNWEGVGIIPDVVVSSVAALDTALVLARTAGEAFRAPRDAAVRLAVREMEAALQAAEMAYRERRPGDGESAMDAGLATGAEHGLVNEFFLNVLAYHYASGGIDELWLAILRKSVDLFPQSADAHEALADALATLGETELAKMHFRRAGELNPDNRNTLKKLEGLGGSRRR